MRMPVLFVGTALLLAAPALAQSPAPAEPATVRDLAALCAPAAGDPRAVEAKAFCNGYLYGVAQYHAATSPPGARPGPLFCPPTSPRPTLSQVAAAFSGWAQANPQHAGDRAVDGLARWARETYPCPADAPAGRAPRRGA